MYKMVEINLNYELLKFTDNNKKIEELEMNEILAIELNPDDPPQSFRCERNQRICDFLNNNVGARLININNNQIRLILTNPNINIPEVGNKVVLYRRDMKGINRHWRVICDATIN